MKKFRFHLLGLTHLPCHRRYNACAYTQKLEKLSRMLMSLEHEVFFYGSEGSRLYCTEFIQTHTLEDIRQDYGEGDNDFEIGYDYRLGIKDGFNTPLKQQEASTRKFYYEATKGILQRKKDDDFLLNPAGAMYRPIDMLVNLFLTCEPGIGYTGSYSKFRAFESNHLQSFMQGVEAKGNCYNGNIYDRVIPNYFDPNDFTFSTQKKDYVLYLGRFHWRKGVRIAYEAAKEAKVHLKLAGSGGKVLPDGTFVSLTDPELTFPKGDWEYVGYVDIEQRRTLLAHAKALLVPTQYLEPFAGVHIEAMLSGTPPITSNFGVFPGTLPEGLNVGFRCNMLREYVSAIKSAEHVNPCLLQDVSRRYLMDSVRWDFQRWFTDLYELYEKEE